MVRVWDDLANINAIEYSLRNALFHRVLLGRADAIDRNEESIRLHRVTILINI